ncbi:hypothetical protein OAO18_07560 [Francisellaceae bacterium]|nr:hypothetical protein [Francisellaceae bacterium]
MRKAEKKLAQKKAAGFANKLGQSEKVFIAYAMQYSLARINKHFTVELHGAA